MGWNPLSVSKLQRLPRKGWDEITYPYPNFKPLHRWRLGIDKQFRPTLYLVDVCDYSSMLGQNLFRVSTGAQESSVSTAYPLSMINWHHTYSHTTLPVPQPLLWCVSYIIFPFQRSFESWVSSKMSGTCSKCGIERSSHRNVTRITDVSVIFNVMRELNGTVKWALLCLTSFWHSGGLLDVPSSLPAVLKYLILIPVGAKWIRWAFYTQAMAVTGAWHGREW